jgi:hypothetical protein
MMAYLCAEAAAAAAEVQSGGICGLELSEMITRRLYGYTFIVLMRHII